MPFIAVRSITLVSFGKWLKLAESLWKAEPAFGSCLYKGSHKLGSEFLKQVDGKFCAAIWDRSRQKLFLVTDKFGLKPIYYAEGESRLLFASEIKALLCDPGVSRDQNVRGLAQFFSLGHFWNNDTFYEAVRVIPAATVAEYDLDSGALEFQAYWRMAPNPDLANLTEEEWIEQIDARLKASVDAQTLDTEHLGIALSGGLDARTVLGLTDHKRVAMTCFSLGMEGSLDVTSARTVSRIWPAIPTMSARSTSISWGISPGIWSGWWS